MISRFASHSSLEYDIILVWFGTGHVLQFPSVSAAIAGIGMHQTLLCAQLDER